MRRSFALHAALLCIVAAGCQGDRFAGNAICDADSFQMEYTVFDRRSETVLFLRAGESLRVTIAQEAGTVDVTVGADGAAPIYEGKGLTSAAFVLNIKASDTYRITVTGHRAQGRVAFIAQRA